MRHHARTPVSPVAHANERTDELYEAYLWLAEHLGLESAPRPPASGQKPQK